MKIAIILKDLQFHPVSEEISHADFLEIDVTKAVNTTLPIKIEGTAPGVRSGGRLIKKYRKLRVNGLIADLPEFLIANIDALELGDSIRVRDLTTEGFDILEAPENAVISCKMTRAAISASGEEGEEGAEGEGTEEASAETVS
jgi:large subunit ribosomal protein L25